MDSILWSGDFREIQNFSKKKGYSEILVGRMLQSEA